ncbi:MAG: PLP-dependent aminotransferase family protein [Desulfobacterales bacterium]
MSPIQTTQLNIPKGMIDFGVGQPSPSLLPLSLLEKAAQHRLNRNDASLLAYGSQQGDGYFRIALARFLDEYYPIRVEPEQLFVTAGASQGLDLICTLFAKPGDTIFVEEPSYFLALRIFRDHQLNIIGLPMDDDGLVVEALQEQLGRHKPVFLYTVPTFHNPSSVTLSTARREKLVQLSQQHNFLIVADEVYHLLAYSTTPPPPPLASYTDVGTVLSLGSFSKILAPGLRLGWIQTGQALMDRLVTCGLLDSGGGLNPFTSGLVRSAIESGLQSNHLEHLKGVYAKRLNVLKSALKRQLPEALTFNEPAGGFFVWFKLSTSVDTTELLHEARQHRVGYLPGIKFSSHQGLKNYVRLSFSYYEKNKLELGIKRLGEVIKSK